MKNIHDRERVHCMVSKEAKDVLVAWQDEHGFKQQDTALESLLLKFGEIKAEFKSKARDGSMFEDV